MNLRDNLLVTMGARAAYMESRGDIKLPEGVEGEQKLTEFVVKTVASYMTYSNLHIEVNFDEFIEAILMNEYGVKKDETPKEIDISEFDKLTVCMSSMIDELKKVIRRPDGIVDSANYTLYKCVQYLELQMLELDKRTR